MDGRSAVVGRRFLVAVVGLVLAALALGVPASCGGGDSTAGDAGDGGADAEAGTDAIDVPDVPCAPMTYYVDYENGDDSNDGICRETPWKHAPGDPEATGNAAAATLGPGWTVLFRGGVVYRGSITIPADGAENSPVVYKGDAWGTERAVIDGSEPLADGWTRCASADDCGGAAAWEHLWYRDVADVDTWSAFYEGDAFLWLAEDPNPPDPLFFDNTGSFRTVPSGSAEITMTATTLTDPTTFTQTDAAFWDGAWLALWVVPNVVVFVPIESFDPAAHAVTYTLDNDVYTDRDAFYAVLNHPSLLDTPGEIAVGGTGRVWVYPRGDADPGTLDVSVSRHHYGFDLDAHPWVVLEGFVIRKYSSKLLEHGMGNGVTNVHTWDDTAVHDVVRNNEITLLRSMSGSAAVTGGDEDFVVEGNFVHDNQKSIGILSGGLRSVIRGNRVLRNGRQGIWFMGARDGAIVGNTVSETLGPHSNGISVYMDSENVLVAGNIVTLSNAAMTLERSRNVTVLGNVFHGNGRVGYVVADWGGITGDLLFAHNAILGSENHCSLMIPDDETAAVVLRNNILDGGGGFDRAHNLYVGLCWNQDERYGWSPADGEFLETDLSRVFVDEAGGNWHSPDGSPAIDAGEDALRFYPTDLFPGFPFGQDAEGSARPLGAAVDIGPYERAP